MTDVYVSNSHVYNATLLWVRLHDDLWLNVAVYANNVSADSAHCKLLDPEYRDPRAWVSELCSFWEKIS